MAIEARKAGEAIRREVMGPAHVDRSLGNASEFEMPLQEATMENAWGSVWRLSWVSHRVQIPNGSWKREQGAMPTGRY